MSSNNELDLNKKFTYTRECIEKFKYNIHIGSKIMEQQLSFNEFLDSIIISFIKGFHSDKLELIAPGQTYYFKYSKDVDAFFYYKSTESKLTFLNLLRKLFKIELKTEKVIKKVPIKFNISGKVKIIFPMSEHADMLKNELYTYINAPIGMFSDRKDCKEVKKLLFNRMFVDKDLEISIDNIQEIIFK